MRRLSLFLLCFIVATASLGGDLYKWVDEKGQVHYSDKPQPGATKINLPAAQTFKAPDAAGVVPQDSPKPAAPSPDRIRIVAPEDQQVFWNTDSVTVSAQVSPGLGTGDTVTFTVDDQKQGPLGNLSATFSSLEKGEHHASVVLTRSDGSTVSAVMVTFYIQRATKK